MKVGEVRIAEDKDFDRLKHLVDVHDGWKLDYNKSPLRVWTKPTKQTDFHMIKSHTIYSDVKASLLYDVLHDPVYRKTWDPYMIDSFDIGFLSPNNDVGYYAAHCPSPMKNRDFVLQRSWLDRGSEYMIFNHSIYHDSVPQKKGFIRAISYLTGYVVRPHSSGGCDFSYVTQSDPKGSLPPWIVNRMTEIFAPQVIKRLHKACLGYELWKQQHNPSHKPWLYPEQICIPRLELPHCIQKELSKSAESLEECGTDENAMKDKEFIGDLD